MAGKHYNSDLCSTAMCMECCGCGQYDKALEDFYNGLADELLWIRERFGDDVYTEVRCSVGCLQNKLTE